MSSGATIAFTDEGVTQQSTHAGGPAVEARRAGERVRIAAYQGEQRTAGYAIRITQIARVDARLEVRATFGEPPPGAITAQVITSPAHTVSVAAADLAGVTTIVLLDEKGSERARTNPP